jgi:hypothetical protein
MHVSKLLPQAQANPPSLTKADPELAAKQAAFLRENSAGLYLYCVGGNVIDFSIEGYDLYLNKLLQDAGDTKDPIARMLIEQIVMAHHHISVLHVRALTSECPKRVEVFEGALARLLGEFRRTVLALKTYLAPNTPANVTVVGQQNVAQNQQVAYVANEPASATAAPKKDCYTELVSKPEALTHVATQSAFAQSETRQSRPAEPFEAKRPH